MSKVIHSPGLVKVDSHSKNSATFTIEPLHTGYGMTLGNSLRRVLLSSIEGAAVTSFKIEGATHEFTTLPFVKEDVVDIMLNLKGLRVRVFSGEPCVLRLSAKGRGVVKASDIDKNADVEIIDPKHVIATLDDDKAKLNMELIVESGRGYRAIDENSYRENTETVMLDAVFSPVQRVRYKVENTRVGQMTDLDRLLLTIDTDNSITPQEAFEEAAAILVNQYTALAGQTRVEAQSPADIVSIESAADDAADEATELTTPIEDLNLSARTTNALVNNDIHTLKDLFSLSDSELRELKGFGNKALDEVKEKLTELEL